MAKPEAPPPAPKNCISARPQGNRFIVRLQGHIQQEILDTIYQGKTVEIPLEGKFLQNPTTGATVAVSKLIVGTHQASIMILETYDANGKKIDPGTLLADEGGIALPQPREDGEEEESAKQDEFDVGNLGTIMCDTDTRLHPDVMKIIGQNTYLGQKLLTGEPCKLNVRGTTIMTQQGDSSPIIMTIQKGASGFFIIHAIEKGGKNIPLPRSSDTAAQNKIKEIADEQQAKETEKKDYGPYGELVEVSSAMEDETASALMAIHSLLLANRMQENNGKELTSDQKKTWANAVLARIDAMRKKYSEDESIKTRKKNPQFTVSAVRHMLLRKQIGDRPIADNIYLMVHDFVVNMRNGAQVGGRFGSKPSKETSRGWRKVYKEYKKSLEGEQENTGVVSGKDRNSAEALKKMNSSERVVQAAGFQMALETLSQDAANPPKEDRKEHDQTLLALTNQMERSQMYQGLSIRDKQAVDAKIRDARARINDRGNAK